MDSSPLRSLTWTAETEWKAGDGYAIQPSRIPFLCAKLTIKTQLFLVEGVITIGFAIIFALILPNSIRNLRGFTEQERQWVLWNFESDLGQQDNSKEVSGRKGLMLALIDPKMWMFMALLTSVYISASVNNFFPSVVGGLGFSRNKTYGLTAPPFVLCVFCMLINGFHSDRKRERYLHIVCPLAITVVANIIAVSTLNIAARCKFSGSPSSRLKIRFFFFRISKRLMSIYSWQMWR